MSKEYVLRNLHLRLTNRCNKKCEHCFASLDNSSIDLPSEYWIGIIKTAIKMGVENITLTGGEPFVYKEIDKLLKQVIELNVPFSIETNGILLGKYIGQLKEAKCLKRVSISPDLSYSKEYLDKLDQLLKECKDAGINVRLQAVILPAEKEKRINYLIMNAKKGIQSRVILGHNGLGKSKDLTDNLSSSEIVSVYNLLSKNDGIFCDLPPLFTKSEKVTTCGWNSFRGDIMPDGRLTPCAAIAWNYPDFILDHVDENNLEDVWDNNLMLNKIRNIGKKDFKGACASCNYFEKCRGSCVALSLGNYGDLFSGYPLCNDSLKEKKNYES